MLARSRQLRVEALHEHLDCERDPRLLAREDDGRCRLLIGGERLPVLYALIEARP